VRREDIGLTIVGPEAPLVAGVVDHFEAQGLRCFGPCAGAAQLEGSKAFSKDFLARHNIPTAAYATFSELEPALAYLRERGAPIVVKADGLAAGKGVIVAGTLAEAEAAVTDMLAGNAFGTAGCRVVIEEFLAGEEASFIVIADGSRCCRWPPARTTSASARATRGRTPAAWAPTPRHRWSTRRYTGASWTRSSMPTLAGMAAEGTPYRGFLYAGLMIDAHGGAARHRVQLPLRRSGDTADHAASAATWWPVRGRHRRFPGRDTPTGTRARHRRRAGRRRLSRQLPQGIADRGARRGGGRRCKVFHAGTALRDAEQAEAPEIVTSGGRVLCATAIGDTLADARRRCYARLGRIRWEDMPVPSRHWLARIDRYSQANP
jgi:phosphoribosylamine--glycine ligase